MLIQVPTKDHNEAEIGQQSHVSQNKADTKASFLFLTKHKEHFTDGDLLKKTMAMTLSINF